MNATFKGTFADWRLVKTRGVIQIVIEVPIEGADIAYQAVGGMPNPAKEIWLAVARLDPEKMKEPAEKPPKERRKFADLSPAQQAGIACADEAFRFFIRDTIGGPHPMTEDEAAYFVREQCNVKSRSEIQDGTDAAIHWAAMYSKFQVWKLAL